MKIIPLASNGSGGASSSSQVAGLKLGIVRLGRAAGKVSIDPKMRHTPAAPRRINTFSCCCRAAVVLRVVTRARVGTTVTTEGYRAEIVCALIRSLGRRRRRGTE